MVSDTEETGRGIDYTPIPIVIGVTGHRDLLPGDIPLLESKVQKILEDLKTEYPDTPLLVLSPLARGADQLIARAGLKQNARLLVPLPLPRWEYEKDFETEESKDEFTRLLNEVEENGSCFELPLVTGNTPENIQSHGPARNKQYAQVGAYIARHSQILIALWNGVNTGDEGGTWEIVGFRLEGIPEPYVPPHSPLDPIDTGPVYRIVTPRDKNTQLIGEPYSLSIMFPTGRVASDSAESAERAYTQILRRMDVFNHDFKGLFKKLEAQIKRNRESLIPEAEAHRLPDTARAILDQYAVADTLAIYFQKWRRWTLITLFAIAVLAVLIFEVYAHLLGEPWLLALFPGSLLLGLLIYLLAKRWDFQDKHLDYRALAEGLRVQLFWNLSGLPDEVAEHYLRQHRTELEWIRNAIRAWNVPALHTCKAGASVGETVTLESRLEMIRGFVLKHWVEKQATFFSGAADRDRGRLRRRDCWVWSLFGLGLALAVLVAALDLILPESATYSRLHPWLIVAMGTAPAVGAALGGFAEKMAFSAQAKRYSWMSALFTRASHQLQLSVSRNTGTEAQSLIRDLGKEALEENGDWVMIHREKTLELPRG